MSLEHIKKGLEDNFKGIDAEFQNSILQYTIPNLLVDVKKAHNDSQDNLEQICNDIANSLERTFTEFIETLIIKVNEINNVLVNSVDSQVSYAAKYKKKLKKMMKDLEALGK